MFRRPLIEHFRDGQYSQLLEEYRNQRATRKGDSGSLDAASAALATVIGAAEVQPFIDGLAAQRLLHDALAELEENYDHRLHQGWADETLEDLLHRRFKVGTRLRPRDLATELATNAKLLALVRDGTRGRTQALLSAAGRTLSTVAEGRMGGFLKNAGLREARGVFQEWSRSGDPVQAHWCTLLAAVADLG